MSNRIRLTVGVLAGAVVLVVAGVLVSRGGDSSVEGSVRYVLAWTDSEEQPATETFIVTTDLGYEVAVTEATLATFSVTMNPCDHDHGGLFGSGGIFGFLAPGIAEAGHVTDHDPALAAGPTFEDIVSGAATSMGSVVVNEPAYCEGHIAFGTTPSTEALAGAEVRPTLAVTGTYRALGTAEVVPFDISATIAWGKVSSLKNESGKEVHAEVGQPFEITIYRDRSTMFDGVDFNTMSVEDQAMSVLRSLADSVRFEVTAGRSH